MKCGLHSSCWTELSKMSSASCFVLLYSHTLCFLLFPALPTDTHTHFYAFAAFSLTTEKIWESPGRKRVASLSITPIRPGHWPSSVSMALFLLPTRKRPTMLLGWNIHNEFLGASPYALHSSFDTCQQEGFEMDKEQTRKKGFGKPTTFRSVQRKYYEWINDIDNFRIHTDTQSHHSPHKSVRIHASTIP